MDTSTTIDLARQAILTTAVLVAPVLLVGLVVGIVMSLLQAITQVQDQAISFVPKLLAIGATLLVCLPWMMDYFADYFREVITQLPLTMVGG